MVPKQKQPSPETAAGLPATFRAYQVRLFLLCFTVVHFAACFLQSHDKPLWLDELFTFHIANRPSASAVLAALQTGAETHPPATYLLGHILIPLLGDADGIRLPAMVGFWLMGVCVFFIVLRSYNFAGAVLAVALPYVTGPFYYAYEGRAYGILLGCAGLAFLSWTHCRREDGSRIWFLALPSSVAIAIWSHFYAVLIGIPLMLGEAYTTIQHRRLRPRVWISLLAGYLALLPLLGMMRAVRANVQVDRSRNVYWLAFAFVYRELFNNFGAVLLLSLLMLAALVLYNRVWAGRQRLSAGEDAPGFGRSELIAVVTFSLMPLWVEVLCYIVAGFYLPRHAMLVVFGFSLLLPPVLWLAGTPPRAVLLTLIGTCLFLFAFQQALVAKKVLLSRDSLVVRQKVLPAIPLPGDLPVAVQDARVCLRWQYYAPPALRARLRYLGSPELGLAYTGASVMDRAMLGLEQITPVQVRPYDTFVAENRQFLVYWDADPPEVGASGWLVRKLLDSHAELQLLAEQGSQFLYLATMPQPAEVPPPAR